MNSQHLIKISIQSSKSTYCKRFANPPTLFSPLGWWLGFTKTAFWIQFWIHQNSFLDTILDSPKQLFGCNFGFGESKIVSKKAVLVNPKLFPKSCFGKSKIVSKKLFW